MSLSPLSNKKSGTQADNLRKEGFNRDNFFSKVEKKFDEKYNFDRQASKSYDNFKSNKNITKKLLKQPLNILKKPLNEVKKELNNKSGYDEIKKSNPLSNIPLNIPATPQQALIEIGKVAVKYVKKVIDLGR